MGNHGCGIQEPLGHQIERFDHVVGISATGAHQMGCCVVHVIEVDLGGERRISRPGKKVKTSVFGKDPVGFFDHASYRRKDEDVVISSAIGNGHQAAGCIGEIPGVDV